MTKANITISDLAQSPDSESSLTELKDMDWLIGHIIGGKPKVSVSVTLTIEF